MSIKHYLSKNYKTKCSIEFKSIFANTHIQVNRHKFVYEALTISHEIKRGLLLGRKAMTNLDSILKSRDIILPIKVQPVKAMVFPVVMYGCENWSIKKAECQRTDA